MQTLRTRRLELVPATLALVEAELESSGALAMRLGAVVPGCWPPGEYDRAALEFFRERLARDPAAAGWYSWYAIHRPTDSDDAVLVGAGGFFGPPGADGIAEVGYSIVPEFRSRGFASELIQALVSHALAKPEVLRVIAHTAPANLASIRVLERSGFRLAGTDDETGMIRYASTKKND
ncbi:GNAT family N-acetyltransferase [Niveibacterium terrae]|uniref:GNAT family N-acetyltransferase n=1 Tax=Niveibacterium terrae TaxID=3373598 RepID=UPI003A95A330